MYFESRKLPERDSLLASVHQLQSNCDLFQSFSNGLIELTQINLTIVMGERMVKA